MQAFSWKAFMVLHSVVHMKSDWNTCAKNGKREPERQVWIMRIFSPLQTRPNVVWSGQDCWLCVRKQLLDAALLILTLERCKAGRFMTRQDASAHPLQWLNSPCKPVRQHYTVNIAWRSSVRGGIEQLPLGTGQSVCPLSTVPIMWGQTGTGSFTQLRSL